MKPIKAKGTKGILISENTFRVYCDKRCCFTDYKIAHNDLSVTIDDEDAYFYGETLDHSPETLGYKKE